MLFRYKEWVHSISSAVRLCSPQLVPRLCSLDLLARICQSNSYQYYVWNSQLAQGGKINVRSCQGFDKWVLGLGGELVSSANKLRSRCIIQDRLEVRAKAAIGVKGKKLWPSVNQI